jgi:hypothetical protein
MPDKVKITVEIPEYLKYWIDRHDISQNGIVTMALRNLYLSEKQVDESHIVKWIENYFENTKLPF